MGNQDKINVIPPQLATQTPQAMNNSFRKASISGVLAKIASWDVGFGVQDKESAKQQHQNKRGYIQKSGAEEIL